MLKPCQIVGTDLARCLKRANYSRNYASLQVSCQFWGYCCRFVWWRLRRRRFQGTLSRPKTCDVLESRWRPFDVNSSLFPRPIVHATLNWTFVQCFGINVIKSAINLASGWIYYINLLLRLRGTLDALRHREHKKKPANPRTCGFMLEF